MPEQLLDAGVTLEGLQRPDRPAPSSTRSPTSRPTTTRRPHAGQQLHRTAPCTPNYPGRLRRRRGRRHAAPGQLDPRPRRPVRAPGHRAAVGREPGADRARHPHLEPRGVGAHALHPQLRRERRLLRPRAAARAAGGHRRASTSPSTRCPPTPAASPDRSGLGFRVPCLLMSPFTQRRLRGHRGVRPHLDPAPDRDALRRPGAQPLGVAPQRDRRHDAAPWRSGKPAQHHASRRCPTRRWSSPLVDEQIILNALTGTFDEGITYPPPDQNVMPVQETTPRGRPAADRPPMSGRRTYEPPHRCCGPALGAASAPPLPGSAASAARAPAGLGAAAAHAARARRAALSRRCPSASTPARSPSTTSCW